MSESHKPQALTNCRVKKEALRWQVPNDWLSFTSTQSMGHEATIIGQDTAKQALTFGIKCSARGQNVFVRGVNGTGRSTLIKHLFAELKPKARVRFDRCYVHNFSYPDKPILLSLPAGSAKLFKKMISNLADYISNDLADALNADYLLARRSAIQDEVQKEIEAMKMPLEAAMAEASLALVSVQAGKATQQAIFPIVEGQAIAPEQFYQLVQEGKVTEEVKLKFETDTVEFQRKIHSINRDVSHLVSKSTKKVQSLNEDEVRNLLTQQTENITKIYGNANEVKHQHPEIECQKIQKFIGEIIEDVIENNLSQKASAQNNSHLYGVNILVSHEDDESAAIIHELTPSLFNLLGTVEAKWNHEGPKELDYRGIHAGSLLRADGGYLIIDVNDIVAEAGAWGALVKILRSGKLEIVPSEVGWMGNSRMLKPEAIAIDVRVILIGDANAYYLLDRGDADFSDLFKVLADFDNEISRDKDSVRQYAQVLANIIYQESLPHFDQAAITEIIEHSARIIAKDNKLTAKFSRVADIMKEAAFVSAQQDAATSLHGEAAEVTAADVKEAIKRTKYRASLPSKKFQNLINTGTINIQTKGDKVGQINGLAVIHAGPITYGFPSRITATIGPGEDGLINIEGQSSMSGSIHTKGFHIISGLLRHVLKVEHPMAFTASIAFEQSYGGIDGDSASGAETISLLSALTGVPIKQSIAMTGAIDQHGKIQAIGGVNEKIEGFYDACLANGLTGNQGVIIPLSNKGDLMLREDVVIACAEGKFSVYAVANISEALAVATEHEAGVIVDNDNSNEYSENSVLAIAKARLYDYWQHSLSKPNAK